MGLRLLLDTHALVWAVSAPERLSHAAREAVLDTRHRLFISSASAWELATKHRLGKLPGLEPLLENFTDHAERLSAELLPIRHDHALRAGALPGAHRDPFDRMLAAQAQLDDLELLTRDPAFAEFEVRTLW